MEHPHLLNCQADSLQMCHLGSLYLYRTIYMCVCECVYVCVCAVIQFSHSVTSDSLWPHGMEFAVHHQLPEITQIHFHPVGDVIQPAHPLQSPSPSIFLSIGMFSNESDLRIRWSKFWDFNFGISPSNEYSGWISFRIDCSIDSRVISNTTVQKNQFFSAQIFL